MSRYLTWVLWVLFFSLPASAVVIAPTPGQEVLLLEEHVLLVFDPLTGTQTIVVQHTFEGTASSFGLLIPTPKIARVKVASSRLRTAIRNKLHPRGRIQRTLDLEFTSWVGGCAMRDVGDGLVDSDQPRSRLRTEISTIGSAPEPLHDWLLENGLTISPVQAAWLADLRARNWSVVGIMVYPTTKGPAPAARIKGPVLALTHEATEPTYPIRHPPFDVDDRGNAPLPPLEIAVLSEWAVAIQMDDQPTPFYADVLTERDVLRMGKEAGGLPWRFRRDGTLTAFQLNRPRGIGVMHFERSDPYPTIRPKTLPREKKHNLQVPIEVLILVFVLLIWGFIRYARPGNNVLGGRLGST